MPEMTIWTPKQIQRYDQPPVFKAAQRKYFLTLPASLQRRVDAFHTQTNQIGFTLMFGYFKACRRFFTPARFHPNDVQFLCCRHGVFTFAFDGANYRRNTYARHQQIILEYFGYEAFDTAVHAPLIQRAIRAQVQSHLQPKLMLDAVLTFLEQQRIERPSYFALHTLITKAVRQRHQQLRQKLEALLEPSHRQALDTLLKQQQTGHELYTLTQLKKLHLSDRPKHIRANLEKLHQLWTLFRIVEPLSVELDLRDGALRFFGELVLHYKVSQITRRTEADRYLLLLAFVAYQIRQFEDWMTDTFLAACRSMLNRVQNRERDYLYTHRKIHKSAYRKAVTFAEDHLNLLLEVSRIVWASQQAMPPTEKILQIRQLLPKTLEQEQDQLQALRSQYDLDGGENEYLHLEKESLALQQQVSGIIKALHFDADTSNGDLVAAIDYFQEKDGQVTKTAPMAFLDDDDQDVLFDGKGENGSAAVQRHPRGLFRVSLYKILLFRAIYFGLKSGDVNLSYSYRYKAFDDYLMPGPFWQQHKGALLDKAGMTQLASWPELLARLKPRLHEQFRHTNRRILNKENEHFRRHKDGTVRVRTPGLDKTNDDALPTLFPEQAVVSLAEVLATVERVTGYLDAFMHLQPRYQKKRPAKNVFFAGITAYGCNLGIETMAQVSLPISAHELEHTANWYFSLENVDKACERISTFMSQLELPNRSRRHSDQLHTSSDGRKIAVSSPETLDATYSFKYFGQDKGVTSYGFIDERDIPFYSTVISTADREAIYVVDGLTHNEAIRSTIHSTDTHGFTEAVFGLTDLLGFGFAPRIARLHKQQLYAFRRTSDEGKPRRLSRIIEYEAAGYALVPKGYIDTKLIAGNWDLLLRLATSIKEKHCTASQIFKRLNSYSRQHPVYQALKEYGKIHKTLYILRFTDRLALRQAVQKQLNTSELSNHFDAAIFFANGGRMIFLTRREQRLAEACKRLIKNAIVCWNYLYLTRRLQHAQEQERQELLASIDAHSTQAWRHVYFNGYYDYSDEKLADTFEVVRSQNFDLDLDGKWERENGG